MKPGQMTHSFPWSAVPLNIKGVNIEIILIHMIHCCFQASEVQNIKIHANVQLFYINCLKRCGGLVTWFTVPSPCLFMFTNEMRDWSMFQTISCTGTRVRPLSLDIPKPLFPVAGFPMIYHHIEAASKVRFWTLLLQLESIQPIWLTLMIIYTQGPI